MILLAILGAFAAATHQDDPVLADRWAYVGTDIEDKRWYVDTDTISRSGNTVVFWQRAIIPESRVEVFDETVAQFEINCQSRVITVLSGAMRSNGHVIDSFSYRFGTQPILPESMAERFHRLLCR